MTKKLDTFKEDFVLFLELGFISVNQADEDSSTKLFKAAHLLQPKNIMPTVGQGYLHLHKLELKQACMLFEEVLEKEPTNEMAKTFLGLCLTFSPSAVTEGEKILSEMSHSKDSQIKNLSHSALDFVDKFVKKEQGPLEVEKKKSPKRGHTK
jgi:hypothetical protein